MQMLVVRNAKRYPKFTLQDVSFSLHPGRITGLIGRNGPGKTTTSKCLLNLVRPDGGSVEMFGRDFRSHEESCKQQRWCVFGGVDFYKHKRLAQITEVTKRF